MLKYMHTVRQDIYTLTPTRRRIIFIHVDIDIYSQNCTDPVTVSMVGEGVVFQGMRGYTVPPHAPAVACLTMSLTQHIWLKNKYHRVPTFNPVGSEATRLSGYQP